MGQSILNNRIVLVTGSVSEIFNVKRKFLVSSRTSEPEDRGVDSYNRAQQKRLPPIALPLWVRVGDKGLACDQSSVVSARMFWPRWAKLIKENTTAIR